MFKHKEILPFSLMSGLAAVLTLIAAISGLLVPGFYEPFMPTTALLAGAYGQDLIALPVALLLLTAILLTGRGSVRALLVWVGCLGYLIYAYLLWSFDAVYTVLFPAYVAILSLSLFSLIGLLGRLDAPTFRTHVAGGIPTRSTAVVVALPAFMAPPWLAFLVQGVMAGQPATINTVLVLDLAFVIPAGIVTAVLLWRRRTWGFIFSGIFLVWMIAMSSALVVSTLWGATLGAPIDPVLPVYALMSILGSVALLRHLRHITAAPTAHASTAMVGAD